MTEKGRFTIPTRSLIRVQSVFHPWLRMEELQMPKIIDLLSVLLTFDFFAPCADCKDGRFRLRLCRAVSFRGFRGSTSICLALQPRGGPAPPSVTRAHLDNLARLTELPTLVVQRSQRGPSAATKNRTQTSTTEHTEFTEGSLKGLRGNNLHRIVLSHG